MRLASKKLVVPTFNKEPPVFGVHHGFEQTQNFMMNCHHATCRHVQALTPHGHCYPIKCGWLVTWQSASGSWQHIIRNRTKRIPRAFVESACTSRSIVSSTMLIRSIHLAELGCFGARFARDRLELGYTQTPSKKKETLALARNSEFRTASFTSLTYLQ